MPIGGAGVILLGAVIVSKFNDNHSRRISWKRTMQSGCFLSQVTKRGPSVVVGAPPLHNSRKNDFVLGEFRHGQLFSETDKRWLSILLQDRKLLV